MLTQGEATACASRVRLVARRHLQNFVTDSHARWRKRCSACRSSRGCAAPIVAAEARALNPSFEPLSRTETVRRDGSPTIEPSAVTYVTAQHPHFAIQPQRLRERGDRGANGTRRRPNAHECCRTMRSNRARLLPTPDRRERARLQA